MMRRCREKLAAAILFAAASGLLAPASAELVKIPLRPNIDIRIAIEPPQGQAAAYALIFAGGHGKLQLDEAGQPQGLRGNFLIRARRHLAARGIGLVLVDAPADYQGPEGLWAYRMAHLYAGDIGQVVSLVKKRYGRPVWLVGTSAGALSVANATARLSHANRPDGVVFTSSITQPTRRRTETVFSVSLAGYTGPALVMSHEQDGCVATPASDAPRLLAALASARPKKLQLFSGGSPPRSEPCEAMAQHGFLGIEPQVMNAIADFILRPSN
jgi:hypothetical protein